MAGKKTEVEKIQVIPVEEGKAWAVPSSTEHGVVYKVELMENGQLKCNCMAGINGRDCKHRKAVRMVEQMKEEGRDQKLAKAADEGKQNYTKMGYQFDQVTSALQKSIRKGDVGQAVFWGLELYTVASYYTWKRLEVIAAEDIGLADVETVKTVSILHQGWELAKKTSWWVSPHQLTLAIILLCRAKKSTFVEDLQSYVMEMMKAGHKLEMPDYAIDGHTKQGKAMGRGGDNWSGWYHFRHIDCGTPVNEYTKKLSELHPEWFDKETLELMENVKDGII